MAAGPFRRRLKLGIKPLPDPFPLQFSNGNGASARHVAHRDDLAAALGDLEPPRPVPVLVGAADSLEPDAAWRIKALLRDSLVPLLERTGTAVIDGGTDSGVMALMGQAREYHGATFPLIGVAGEGTVTLPGGQRRSNGNGVPLEPNHPHFLLVPGDCWGDEAPWIAAAAGVLAKGAPSLTLAAGGGRVTRLDLELSLQAGRRTLLLEGCGGATDDLARALHSHDFRALGLDETRVGLLIVADFSEVEGAVDRLLSAPVPRFPRISEA